MDRLRFGACPVSLLLARLRCGACPVSLLLARLRCGACPVSLLLARLRCGACPVSLLLARLRCGACPVSLLLAGLLPVVAGDREVAAVDQHADPAHQRTLSNLRRQRIFSGLGWSGKAPGHNVQATSPT